MKKLLFFIIIGASCTACTKQTSGDSQPPVVSLTSPVNLQIFPAGKNISIKASITDDDRLSAIHLNIEGPDFIHYAFGSAGKSYDLSEEIPLPIKGKYSISVEAEDYGGNHGKAQVDITVN